MLVNKWTKGILILFALLFLCTVTLPSEAWARVGGGGSRGGGGGSIGSRGSRTGASPTPYTAPGPTQPSQPFPGLSPAPRPATPSPAAPLSSFWRSFAGGMLGGFAGGLLFHSLFGGGMGGFGGGGVGLLDILLLVGIGYLLYRYLKKRGEEAPATVGAYQSSTVGAPAYQASYPPAYDQPQAPAWERDLEQGLANIRQFDPSFDEARFQDAAMDLFFKVQGAWANRDMSTVRELLTDEMFRILQDDLEQMKAEKKINRLENIAVRHVDLTEAWQEAGADFLTARIYANLLDYQVDEITGQVLEGSKTDPVKFEEYWTFTRPVGNNPWRLSAIQQAPA